MTGSASPVMGVLSIATDPLPNDGRRDGSRVRGAKLDSRLGAHTWPRRWLSSRRGIRRRPPTTSGAGRDREKPDPHRSRQRAHRAPRQARLPVSRKRGTLAPPAGGRPGCCIPPDPAAQRKPRFRLVTSISAGASSALLGTEPRRTVSRTSMGAATGTRANPTGVSPTVSRTQQF
jgi:hypothetical protein